MNIKERLANIGQTILIGISFFGLLFIIVGLKSTETNWLFVGIGIVLSIPFLVYKFWLKNNTEKIIQKQEIAFQKFLKTADRIHVILDDAKIVEKKHTEVQEVDQDYRAAAFNEISGNGHYNEERITHTYCEVTFTLDYKGEKLIVEEIIPKDETSVRMYFYTQKITTFYINPNDMNQIYMDLTFIEN